MLFIFQTVLNAQHLLTPLEESNYTKLTSYDELISFLENAVRQNSKLSMDCIAESVEGRKIPAIKISSGEFGKDKEKIKVLIFAQQHGNEPSGKEGALLLIARFANGDYDSLLNRIDLIIVPQMNPDGSEKDVRRNGNNADLNRDHLTLLQPETTGLHKLFDKYLPEATMDVHEYFPYSEDWEKYGYIKKFDEQIGATTNINISENIRSYSNIIYFPFIKNYLNEQGFSFQNYILGGPPEEELIRHSTYDINDGRQSFGILNSFSFIQEGLNGRDSIENIKHRSEGQATGMLGFLDFIYLNKNEIKSMVEEERSKLISGNAGDEVAIQLDHVPDGSILKLNLFSLYSNADTVITVKDYRPVVKSLLEVKRPLGYLIPKDATDLVEWAKRQNIVMISFNNSPDKRIEQYFVRKIDSINFEGDTIVNPVVELSEVKRNIIATDYLFIPTSQLKNNLIVIALEPKSMLGLVTYKKFEHLHKSGEYFPILRVVDQKE